MFNPFRQPAPRPSEENLSAEALWKRAEMNLAIARRNLVVISILIALSLLLQVAAFLVRFLVP